MNKRKFELIWFSKYSNYVIGFFSNAVYDSIAEALGRAEAISYENMIIEFESSNMVIATTHSNLYVIREMDRDST